MSISGAVIAAGKPGSLLFGRTAAADGSNIQVVANTVTVGAGTKLTADQISLVANQSIDVQNGALLQSTSAVSGTAPAPAPAEESVTLAGATGDTPALLAVSDTEWAIPVPAPAAAHRQVPPRPRSMRALRSPPVGRCRWMPSAGLT